MDKEGRKKLKTRKIKETVSKFIYNEEDVHEDVRENENKRPLTTALKKKKPKLKRLKSTPPRIEKHVLTKQKKESDAYGKEDWECYRTNFQKSYEKSSQLYYDALESPSNIADLYPTSSSSANEVNIDTSFFADSSGDEILPPSQHDFEVIKLRKSKGLLDEIYHKDLDAKLTLKNDEPDELQSSSIISLTLSQLCKPKTDFKHNSPNEVSFITFSDDDSVFVENIASQEAVKQNADKICLEPIYSESDSDCIILPESQLNSPIKASGQHVNQHVQDTILPTTDTFALDEKHDCQMQEKRLSFPNVNNNKNALVLNDSEQTSFMSSMLSKDLTTIQKKKNNPKTVKPKATELNNKLKQMGIKLSNQELVSKFENLTELQQLIALPQENNVNSSGKNTRNPSDLKLNLICALKYDSHIDFLDKLTTLIQNLKNDQEKMSLLLEKPDIKCFFMNISIGKPWKLIEFRESLLSFVKNLIILNGDPQENNNVVLILQLLDYDILREWSEDELGACFEMSQ